jgi:hypothetical protein
VNLQLHDYQKVAVEFLRGQPRAALFLDMGLYSYPMSKKIGRPRIHPLPAPAVCEGCGGTFEMGPGQRFHTQACFLKTLNQDPERQRAKGRKGGEVRGQQIQAQERTGTYLKQDGQNVHRTVAEAVLGRSLLPHETVHHEDLNKWNNEPENLIVFPSQAWHARHHKLGHTGNGRCACQGIRLGEVTPNAAP